MHPAIWMLSALFALAAGITDLRSRRIPNWLTYPAAPLAVALHAIAGGWPEAKVSLKGFGIAFAVFLILFLLRALGGGDLKLAAGLGAFVGVHHLADVIVAILLINALIAIVLIISKRRMWRTLKNIGRLIAAFFRFHLPERDLTIDNPEAIKVPFGVAAAIAVLLYVGAHWRGPF
jgi:prepilin peptidase CpaA